MTFFIQHGYGKASKIANVASAGHVSGLVLSPADEDRDALGLTAEDARSRDLRVLLDPQAYIYAATPAGSARCHDSHGLDLSEIHWSQDAAATTAQVRSVELANRAIGVDGLKIAPTVLQGAFADVWTPLAIQLARTAASEWGAENTLASIVVEEAAFSDWQTVEDWLDVATTLDVRGFYLLVDRRRREYPPLPWDKNRLTNLLRMIYRLSVLNDYEVLWGYSDFEGILGLAAGADGSGSGWNYSLRQFSVSKWQPSAAGGQPPIARISLSRLWVPLKAEAEASPLFDSELRDDLFADRYVKRFASEPFTTWSRSEAQEQHLRVLAWLADEVAGEPDIGRRVDAVTKRLERASKRLQKAAALGIALPPSYSSRIENFLGALDGLANSEAL
ncbi:hypothetical protein [Pedococcus soli]